MTRKSNLLRTMRNRLATQRAWAPNESTTTVKDRLVTNVNDTMEHRGGWHFESKGTGNVEAKESSLQRRAKSKIVNDPDGSESEDEERSSKSDKEKARRRKRKKEKKSKKKRNKKEKKGKRRSRHKAP